MQCNAIQKSPVDDGAGGNAGGAADLDRRHQRGADAHRRHCVLVSCPNTHQVLYQRRMRTSTGFDGTCFDAWKGSNHVVG